MNRIMVTIAAASVISAVAQSIEGSPEYIRNLTAKWDGERFENGRVRSYKGKLPMSREQLEKYLKDRNF